MTEDRRRSVALVAAALVAAAVLVAILVVGVRSTPDFPALDEQGLPGLEGTIAWVDSTDDGDGFCVRALPASGGDVVEVVCDDVGDDGGPGMITFDEDGRLVVVRYTLDGEQETTYDLATGDQEELEGPLIGGVEPFDRSSTTRADGARLEVDSDDGDVTMAVVDGAERTVVLEASGPLDYQLWAPWWLPDGRGALVEDDHQRLLLVDTETNEVRVVATDVGYTAATGVDVLGGS